MIRSFKNNQKGIQLMLVSSFCVCLGQLLWKLIPSYGVLSFLGGFILYGLGALVIIVAYRFGSLSVLQPMMSMNYVITTLLAVFLLKETMSLVKLIGILIIIMGVVLIGGGDDQ